MGSVSRDDDLAGLEEGPDIHFVEVLQEILTCFEGQELLS